MGVRLPWFRKREVVRIRKEVPELASRFSDPQLADHWDKWSLEIYPADKPLEGAWQEEFHTYLKEQ